MDLKYSMAFKETKDELIKIAEGKNCWDILEHSKEENEHYFRLNSLIQEYGYISIILRHISIEGLINDIAFRFLGEKIFYSEIDKSEYRLSFIEKIEKVYRLISKKKFQKGNKLYANLKDLNSVRNTLIHMKSEAIGYDDLVEPNYDKFLILLNRMMGNKKTKVSAQKDYVRVVEETRTVYDDLVKLFSLEVSEA